MKIIAVLGEPGTGKTTLMKQLKDEQGATQPRRYNLLLFHSTPDNRIAILGRYDAKSGLYGGTDQLSMAASESLLEFLEFCRARPKQAPQAILFEGDRFATATALEACQANGDLEIIRLTASDETLQKRYRQRGSRQNENWLKGRRTKLNNLESRFKIERKPHETRQDTGRLAAEIQSRLFSRQR